MQNMMTTSCCPRIGLVYLNDSGATSGAYLGDGKLAQIVAKTGLNRCKPHVGFESSAELSDSGAKLHRSGGLPRTVEVRSLTVGACPLERHFLAHAPGELYLQADLLRYHSTVL